MIEMSNFYRDSSQDIDTSGVTVELIDGLYPQIGAYIQVKIPDEKLQEPDGFLRKSMIIYITLSDVLMTFRGTADGPAPSRARKDIALFRAYADHLEQVYIKGHTAQPEDMDESASNLHPDQRLRQPWTS